MAFKEIIKEHTYLRNVISYLENSLKLNVFSKKVPMILTDSQSAMKLAENPEFHKRSKHIDIQYHYIRECLEKKIAQMGFVSSKDQLADGLTKGLDLTKHKQFLINTGLLK